MTAPLWVHAIVLCLVLFAFVVLSRPGFGVSSDEGAAVAQAKLLDRGTWLYDYPLSWMDNADAARPFVRGDAGSKGVAPYAKHPLYPVAIWAVGSGTAGAYALSIAGTASAALLAAALARRFGATRGAIVATLWITGVATPLLVDAALVLAHTLAAALVASAALASLAAVTGSRRRAWWATGAALLAAAAASALRTEAGLVLVALAIATVVVQRTRRSIAVGAALVVGVAVARGLETLAIRAIVGTRFESPGHVLTPGLQGRWEGLYTTWLRTSYEQRTAAGTLLWVGLAALAVAAVLVRSRRISGTAFGVVAIFATAVYLLRLFVDPVGVVPGLVPVVPLLWTLGWLVSPRRRGRAWVSTAIAAVAGAGLVLGTQYSIGGGWEWGGRYFAVLLPMASAVIVTGAAPTLATVRLTAGNARVLLATAVATSVVIAALGFATVRKAHTDAEALTDRIAAAVVEGDGSRVVVTPNRLLPQLLHPDVDRYEWVAASQRDVGGFTSQLAARVDQIVFVAPGAVGRLDEGVRSDWTIRTVDDSAVYDVVVLERTRGG